MKRCFSVLVNFIGEWHIIGGISSYVVSVPFSYGEVEWCQVDSAILVNNWGVFGFHLSSFFPPFLTLRRIVREMSDKLCYGFIFAFFGNKLKQCYRVTIPANL